MDILVITSVIFLVVVLAVLGLYFGMTASRQSPKSEVKRRLRAIALGQPSDDVMPSILKEEILSEIPLLNRILYRVPFARRLDGLLNQADVKIRVSTLLLITAVLIGFAIVIGFLAHKGVVLTLILIALLGAAPFIFLFHKKGVRLRKFTEQFPDTLDMIARSLRAGHSFTSAMQVVYQEMPDPVAKVFRIAHDEQNLGLSLPEALSNMTEAINSIDLNFFITAVNIQRETGGNLSEILEKLGVTIRERFKILGQLRVYTAQGRLSGYILAAMPVVLAIILWVINPGYLKVLITNRVGMYMIGVAVVLQVIGFFVIRKIIKIQI